MTWLLLVSLPMWVEVVLLFGTKVWTDPHTALQVEKRQKLEAFHVYMAIKGLDAKTHFGPPTASVLRGGTAAVAFRVSWIVTRFPALGFALLIHCSSLQRRRLQREGGGGTKRTLQKLVLVPSRGELQPQAAWIGTHCLKKTCLILKCEVALVKSFPRVLVRRLPSVQHLLKMVQRHLTVICLPVVDEHNIVKAQLISGSAGSESACSVRQATSTERSLTVWE